MKQNKSAVPAFILALSMSVTSIGCSAPDEEEALADSDAELGPMACAAIPACVSFVVSGLTELGIVLTAALATNTLKSKSAKPETYPHYADAKAQATKYQEQKKATPAPPPVLRTPDNSGCGPLKDAMVVACNIASVSYPGSAVSAHLNSCIGWGNNAMTAWNTCIVAAKAYSNNPNCKYPNSCQQWRSSANVFAAEMRVNCNTSWTPPSC